MEPRTSQLTGRILPPSTSRCGVALVIVLGFLVLITVVIVAFLTSVSTEHSTASIAAAGATGKELADASVQLVIGQIRQATSMGPNVAWASQPGMIRTYGSGGTGSYTASSSPLAYYKLYSSDNMVVDSASISSFVPRDDVNDNWYNQPAVFTDLNAPVTSSAGTLNYPIMDPGAADIPSGKSDPMVEGFSITSAPTAAVSATNPTPNPAPMPAKWIYVLRDGTLTAPIDADSTATAAEFKNASAGKIPTADNPIVGRVAFWTDDETCKLNLNTACGGTYWDTPRFTTCMELNFSRYKPAAKEYYRFPGHPATTGLVPVFWSLTGMSTPNDNLFPTISPPLRNGYYDAGAAIGATLSPTANSTWLNLLQFAPRNASGGSQMGSVPTNGDGISASGGDVSGFASVVPDADRLYASVDEALFGFPGRGALANANALTMTNDQLRKLPFFLTTTSRSPETNPFNQPKVGIWPVPQLAAKRSAADKLFAFCSTLKPDATGTPSASNNFTYFFTRNDSTSNIADFASGSRNDKVFDYLDTAFQNPIPGFGASVDSRYATGGRRLLTLIYDFIRSTVNLIDTSFSYTVSYANGNTTKPYNVYNNTFVPSDPQYLGFGQAVPIKITKGGVDYKGAGRFPVISQAGIVFVARAANVPPGNALHPVINAAGAPYPTIDRTGAINPVTSGATLDAALATRPEDFQTHAGLPFLTVGRSATPTVYDIPNPRYQGQGTLYPVGPILTGPTANPNADHWGKPNSRVLPDPQAAISAGGLPTGATQMQALILIDPVDLTCGSVPLTPSYLVKITGASSFQADGTSMGFPDPATQSVCWQRMPNPNYYLGWNTISAGDGTYANDVATSPYYNPNIWGSVRRSTGTGSSQLSFISVPVVVAGPTFAFTGGTIQVDIYAGPTAAGQSNIPTTALGPLVQTYHITFPNATFPTPMLPPMPAGYQGAQFGNELIISNPNTPTSNFSSYSIPNTPGIAADLVSSNMLTPDPATPLARVTSGKGGPNYGVGPLTINGASSAYMDGEIHLNGWGSNYIPVRSRFYYETGNSNDGCRTAYFLPEHNGDPIADEAVKRNCDTIRSVECVYGDPRVYVSMPDVGTQFFAPHRWYFDATKRGAHTFRGATPTQPPGSEASAYSLYRGATEHFLSDAYLTNANWNYNPLNNTAFARNVGNRLTTINWLAAANSSLGCQVGIASGSPCVTSSAEFDPAVVASSTSWTGLTPLPTIWATGGDFCNGIGSEPDGPYLNKPNETGGSMQVGQNNNNLYPEWWQPSAYASGTSFTMPAQFSPNRMIASPVAFGSLPTGNTPADAWHTLLFCPNPNASSSTAYATRMGGTDVTSPGAVPTGSKCPDHLLLDFFTMPVVEPYAISEPFSTAGKVNMNYQIAPFTYINRNTALRGVFAGTMVTAVDDKYVASPNAATNSGSSNYKSVGGNWGYGGPAFARASGTDVFRTFLEASGQWGFRYPIHAGETLRQFQARFDNGDIFRSPSEICSLFLYPATQPTSANPSAPGTALVQWDAANANILNWWYANPAGTRKSLTGDNLRERPYDSLYPRLTTKSNSYTVHFRVQVLKKIPGTSVTQWVDGKDVVASEYRGASLIERYIDPSDPNLPDFAINPTATLDNYYKFRVVSTKKFTAE